MKYTEGRFAVLFLGTFYEGNDPSIEAWDNRRKARRAILRSRSPAWATADTCRWPQFPVRGRGGAHLDEFRDIHDRTDGEAARAQRGDPGTASKMRSWMAYTVAHALPNKQTYSYYGILESLSGMRVNVRFISFDDVLSMASPTTST